MPGSAHSTLCGCSNFTLSEIQQPFTKLPVGVLISRYSLKALHFGTLFAPAVISTSDSMLQQLELIGFYRFIEEKVVCVEHSLIPLKPQQFLLQKRVFSENRPWLDTGWYLLAVRRCYFKYFDLPQSDRLLTFHHHYHLFLSIL